MASPTSRRQHDTFGGKIPQKRKMMMKHIQYIYKLGERVILTSCFIPSSARTRVFPRRRAHIQGRRKDNYGVVITIASPSSCLKNTL